MLSDHRVFVKHCAKDKTLPAKKLSRYSVKLDYNSARRTRHLPWLPESIELYRLEKIQTPVPRAEVPLPAGSIAYCQRGIELWCLPRRQKLAADYTDTVSWSKVISVGTALPKLDQSNGVVTIQELDIFNLTKSGEVPVNVVRVRGRREVGCSDTDFRPGSPYGRTSWDDSRWGPLLPCTRTGVPSHIRTRWLRWFWW